VRRIAISGLVALAAMLGGAAIPTAAMAQPTAAVRPTATVRPAAAAHAGSVGAMRPGIAARPADVDLVDSGVPALSCVLASDCLGIEGNAGVVDDAPRVPARVERWNGSSWKRLAVAMPTGTASADLLGVSCRTAKSCLVVGNYYKSASGVSRVLALSYNGTSLKPTPTVPLPKGTTDAALSSVSCATTRYCVAIGVADGGTSAFGTFGSVTIIETWNGAKWALHTAAESTGKTAIVVPSVVSCATSAFCVLAGADYGASAVTPYVASWNGTKLTTMKAAKAGSSADLVVATGVSCATGSNCAITGGNLVPTANSTTLDSTAFTEIWNGKTWQLAKVAWPKGTADSFTASVSCYAAHSCEAVGEQGATSSSAVAVSFNGTTGTVQAVPGPSKGDSNGLDNVSCLPWGSCVAIGYTGKTTATSPALMTGVWNGKAWKLDPGF
jgi:hypothetical protein